MGESGKGKKPIRFGWVGYGTYCAPYNLHKCFAGPPWNWDIEDWRVNTEKGIAALAHHLKKSKGNLRGALRKYNTTDKGKKFNDYCNHIKSLAETDFKWQ